MNNSTSTLETHQPLVQRPMPLPKRWGEAEREQLEEMLEQKSLFYWKGPKTDLLIERFQAYYPLEHVMACSSGTAGIHIAVLAAGIAPGDEVIVPPITDMGTMIGVLYQGAVPVFADLEAHTYNLDPRDVAAKITPRTKAVIAVHLAGNPCDLQALRALCDQHDLVLIEDCAQAWGARYNGQPIGTIGDIACFSLNDFKHIGCGDGGIVASNHPEFGPKLQMSGDKNYKRDGSINFLEGLAPNYRISEPQSAVAAAQMLKMSQIAAKRGAMGHLLSEHLQDVDGISLPQIRDEDDWSCWFYLLRVDAEEFGCDSKTFAADLGKEGVPCSAGYIKIPIYKFPVFQNEAFFAGTWPTKMAGLTTMEYRDVCCPETEAILESCVQIPINQAMDEDWIEGVGRAIRKIAANYRESL